MISVYFNTTLDAYYQAPVSVSSFSGKKIFSSEVLLTPKATVDIIKGNILFEII